MTASANASLTRVGVTVTAIETAHATTSTAIEATAVGLDGSGSSEGGKGHEGGKTLDSGGSVDTGKSHGGLITNDGTVLAQATASRHWTRTRPASAPGARRSGSSTTAR